MNTETTFVGQQLLNFVKEKGRWYIDLPSFIASGEGIKDDLIMVAGADTLCDALSNGKNRLAIMISTTPFNGGDFSIQRMDNEREVGCDYRAYYKGRYVFPIWLGPPLHYVMGTYPTTVYFKPQLSN